MKRMIFEIDSCCICRTHPDPAPDSTGLAERRSPIRRNSEVFATPAGSETGAPGAGSSCRPVSGITQFSRLENGSRKW